MRDEDLYGTDEYQPGFTWGRPFHVYRRDSDAVEPTVEFVVELPHQCDAWDIGGGTRAEAITELEAFLEDGARALAALRAAPDPTEVTSTPREGHGSVPD